MLTIPSRSYAGHAGVSLQLPAAYFFNAGCQWQWWVAQARRAIDAMKLERLQGSLDTGLADLARGDYEHVKDEQLQAWFDRIAEQAGS